MVDPTITRAVDTLASDDFQSDLMPPVTPGREDDLAVDRAAEVIIRSKVRAPVLRESTLSRQRLLDWMDQHAEERLRILAAEAGFGKTTLLADWARRTAVPVRWLKLDPTDAEWTTFISYLVAAFQEGDPSFGVSTLRLLGHVATLGVTRDQVTSQLIAELGAAVIEPTALIIDDIQHVQGNADVGAILERLVERASPEIAFILSGRGRPTLKLGRQTAQGNVVTLGTDDLRFTRAETADLFRTGYRIPLDGDLVGVVDSRTEGWAASLQLIYSSLRGQRKAEIRDFIRALQGSHDPLYDFLAEEVLGRQPVDMQRVLLHASILDRIVPAWVVAALSVAGDPPDAAFVSQALELADELGLMSRSAEQSASRRFHPLLREFLVSHLHATSPADVIRLMHLRVAEAAESSHWPTSAHHFIEAGEGDQAMRVISDATILALGTGAWATALELLDRAPNLVPTPPVIAIRARSLTMSGCAPDALALLHSVDVASLSQGRDRALIRLAIASAMDSSPDHHRIPEVLADILADEETPSLPRHIARAWYDLHTDAGAQSTAASVRRLAHEAGEQGLHLYVGLARHNLCLVQLARGRLDDALVEGKLAVAAFERADSDEGHMASAILAVAHVEFALGNHEEAMRLLDGAIGLPMVHPDALAEAALILVWMGHDREASALIKAGWASIASRSQSPLSTSIMHVAEAVLQLARGLPSAAWTFANQAQTTSFDANQSGLVLIVRAVCGVSVFGGADASPIVDSVADELRGFSVDRWSSMLLVLRFIAASDFNGLADIVCQSKSMSSSTLLVGCDAIAPTINYMESVPDHLDAHVRRWASRWRPALRRALNQAGSASGRATARLLAEIGTADDVLTLRVWEQKRKRAVRDHSLSSRLARRVSPTLVIRDLGRTSISLRDRQVMMSDVRRRAASLLLYLVSRPRHTATKDQVFEALWPEQGESQAANSLHQTLYFLRQELVGDKVDGKPIVEYVPVESELVYLTPELVHVESASFVRQALDLSGARAGTADALAAIQSYSGKFAAEFEYEDWAISWRDHVHASFLDLAEQAARTRLPSRAPEASAVLKHALGIDPEALELKPLMAAAMFLSGSEAAARHLYRQYAVEYEKEYGEVAPPLGQLVDDVRQGPTSAHRARH